MGTDRPVYLKTDIDVYNDTLKDKLQQIQLILDFSDDVAEREELERMQKQPSGRDRVRWSRRLSLTAPGGCT